MALEFAGPALPLNDEAIEDAAKKIGCQVAAVRAVIDVESRGGFLSDKRPKILFERHYFSRLTKRKFDASHPTISHRKWGGYKGGTREYDRLAQAIKLDRDAALRSASWGAFQIMGDNYKVCGFGDVEDFVAAMVSGEPAHLDAFVGFVKRNNLDDELRRLDWAGFARGYNGPAYRKNKYDTKLSAAFAFHSHGGSKSDSPRPLLRMGDTGEDVRELQEALGGKIVVDGDFGPATKMAVIRMQKKHGLYPDGIVGKQTWAVLAPD
ncbi:MAG: N-acetylmuramidase domain-containing protein [Pseudomonadota bacterium]